MEWYEIVSMFLFFGGYLVTLGILVFYEKRRNNEAIRCLKKEQQFYDIAGEWFNNQLNK